MQTVLVTGGAGYIGSHACKALRDAGYLPITFDNFSTGWKDAVKFGPFEEGDLLDRARIEEVLDKHKPVGIMHFAALSQVGESVEKPELYWKNNVTGSLNLIAAAVEKGVNQFVFSSTCATYGDQDNVLLTETTPQFPENPYASSKKAIEDMLRDFSRISDLSYVIFRYFNVAGADPDAEVGEFHRPETHLIPVILDVISGERPELVVNGNDYATADGTCVRDYVHVMDLVDAHVAGIKWLENGKGSTDFNLGTGHGYSVAQVLDAAKATTNRDLPFRFGPRRAGDCAKLVSGSSKAKELLGWTPKFANLSEMIGHAWKWHQHGGYER